MKNYEEFIDGLRQDTEIPAEVDAKFEQTLSELPNISVHKKRKSMKWVKWVSSVAAVFVLGIGFCYTNPVLAAKIPIIGRIFEQVEQDVTYSGDYKEKGTVLVSEEGSGEDNADTTTKYTTKDQGLEITASEVYCDGYSIFLTAKITSEAGGFDHIQSHYTGGFRDGEATMTQGIYTNGNWQMEDGSKSGELLNNNFEGSVLDDHTFIGMMKFDLDEVISGDGVLNLNLSFLGYDDINWLENDDLTPYYKFEGNWQFSIPYTVDTETAKEITVNQKSDLGYGIEKVFLSPYQLIVFTEVPYTTLSEEEFSREDYKNLLKETPGAEDDEDTMTYEEYINFKSYADRDLSVFNQDGEVLMFQGGDTEKTVFAVKGLDISDLHIFVGQKFGDLSRETDMEKAKSIAIMEVDVKVN